MALSMPNAHFPFFQADAYLFVLIRHRDGTMPMALLTTVAGMHKEITALGMVEMRNIGD